MFKNINLIFYPDKKLRQKSKKVEDVLDPEIQELIKKMIEIMHKENGVGISAIQVGVPLQIIVVEHQGEQSVIINPKIYRKSLSKSIDLEGCLSLPGVYGPVKRSKIIKIKGLDVSGQEVDIRANGLVARIIQHEYDHTEGILFIDKMVNSKESRKVLEKLQQMSDKM